jgi:uncharacterized protein (DUF169 family)
MMQRPDIAGLITSLLELEIPPVALTFVDEPPPGVPAGGPVPSSCAFWREAERGVFFAPARDHFNCPVGAMVMGFDLPEDVTAQLGGLVETMCDHNYISPEEAAHIPSVQRTSAGIVYGPLADLPAEPDVVLLWASPEQAMLVNESGGGAQWSSTPNRVGGRPACAALPLAMAGSRPALSFGCAGMRTFTGMPSDRMLVAVPGEGLAAFVDALAATVEANRTMHAFYEQRRAELVT